MKRKHAGAQSKKHGCKRCGKHARQVFTFATKAGRLYNLCPTCAKSLGKAP